MSSGARAFLTAATGRDIRPVERVLASMDDMHAWVRGQAGDRFDRIPGRMLGIEADAECRPARPHLPLVTPATVGGATLRTG